MSFRKEIKVRLTKHDYESIKNKFLCDGMKPLYPKRAINSLYYDTEVFCMHLDSEEGLLPRRKVRLRWYNDIRKANHEVKISSIEGRFKTSSAFYVPSEYLLPKHLHDTFYGVIYPSLRVFYVREYFLFEQMRITFDSDIRYINQRLSQSIPFEDGECVMEIKVGIESSDDFVERMIPFQTSRFSKYSRGLLVSKGQL